MWPGASSYVKIQSTLNVFLSLAAPFLHKNLTIHYKTLFNKGDRGLRPVRSQCGWDHRTSSSRFLATRDCLVNENETKFVVLGICARFQWKIFYPSNLNEAYVTGAVHLYQYFLTYRAVTTWNLRLLSIHVDKCQRYIYRISCSNLHNRHQTNPIGQN